ncbi:lipopolysaccharide kinase InaA family protein [Metapseudomonas furukawaii]|uniref:phosphotransferase n=1 Tax=Metapseudomonas furukawaii TaxID=1149133 RepID=UPI00227D101F|nr:phosphotransferase [Pseudomonas furukawaii]WAG78629.1 lipopolysaccharide kinase InaA family protein [Pseudomonas furukawaii]
MKALAESDLENLLLGARTIEADGYGLKVAHLADGSFLKIFRRKRLLSSSLWSPPAQRFANNARQLNQLGVPAPSILETFRVPQRNCNGVRYIPLPGQTLRDSWRTLRPQQREEQVKRFGQFLAKLHQLGVYFRSLHLGNVLLMPDQQFGLIDLSDMHISGRPLSWKKRRRNMRHVLRYEEDRDWLADQHLSALLAGYADGCGEPATKDLAKALEQHQP